MKFVDYNYIATMIGDFSRVPVHIYKNNELILGPFQGKIACTNSFYKRSHFHTSVRYS